MGESVDAAVKLLVVGIHRSKFVSGYLVVTPQTEDHIVDIHCLIDRPGRSRLRISKV